MELVCELLGLDDDSGPSWYFWRHYGMLSPKLQRISRTTFARRVANLCLLKYHLRKHLLKRLDFDEQVSVINSFPAPVRRFARATRRKRLCEASAHGYDEMAR